MKQSWQHDIKLDVSTLIILLYNKWHFLGSQGFPLLKIPASLHIKLVLTLVICTRHVSLKQMCRLTLHSSSTKINQRGIIKKWNNVELWFLCTAPRVIARNMHTKFGMIWQSYAPNKEIWTPPTATPPPPPPPKVIPICHLFRRHKNCVLCRFPSLFTFYALR